MKSAWLFGFIFGILLGKTPLFLYLQSPGVYLVTGIILIPVTLFLGKVAFSKRVALALFAGLFGLFWGWKHSAPAYVGRCTEFEVVSGNALPTSQGPSVVSIGNRRYEITLRKDQAKVTGRVVNTGFLWQQVVSSRCGPVPVEISKDSFRSRIVGYYIDHGGSAKLSGWISAAVLGSRSELSFRIVKSFQDTGLIHLLVVSGLHVGLIATFFIFIVRAPFLLLYSGLLISPGKWRIVATIIEILSAVFVVGYVVLIAAPQSAQRAALFFIVWVLAKNIFGVRRPSGRFLTCLFFQSAVFPVGFFSAGNIMSWIATLYLVTRHRGGEEEVSGHKFLFDWRLQLKILCLAAVVFNGVSPLGLPANLLLAPAFGFILYLTCFNLVFPFLVFSTATYEIVRAYISIVESFAGLAPYIGRLGETGHDLVLLFRAGCLVYSTVAVLNSLRILTIRLTDD